MKIFSDINYYYHEIVRSNVIKKSTELTAAVAFYIFHSIKTIVALPASPISSLPDLIFFPVLTSDKVSRMIEKWDNRISRPVPPQSLARMIHKVDSIANWIFGKICYLSLTLPSYPYTGIIKAADYIEDTTTEISQKAIDAMHIPVQLSISPKNLKSILEEWKNRGSPGEDREKAVKAIWSFYEESRNLISNLYSPAESLSLEKCQLQTLPDIFHYKPFSTLRSLNLSGNQLSGLPENIDMPQGLKHLFIYDNNLSSIPKALYNVPNTCMIYTDIHKFSIKEIARMSPRIAQANYTGPQINSIDMLRGAVLFAEKLLLSCENLLKATSTYIDKGNFEEDKLTVIKKELISIENNISLFDSLPCVKLTDHLCTINTALIDVCKRAGMEASSYQPLQDNYKQFTEDFRMYTEFLKNF